MAHVTLIVESLGYTAEARLDDGRLTVGRTDSSTIAVPGDQGLSRRHASFFREGGGVRVVDEHSTNGTFVKGAPIPQDGVALADGDKVSVGNHTTIIVHITASPSRGVNAENPAPVARGVQQPPVLVFSAAAALIIVLGAAVLILKAGPEVDSERAGNYRDAVDKEFVNGQNINPPLIGYVVAMSRTKFAGGGDVWGLPAPLLERAGGASATPEATTREAAAYVKDLLDAMGGRDRFAYAVACYGLTLDEVGEVRQKLESADPEGRGMYDFWKMKNAGVITGEQAVRVARFFAAGIVCENPQLYGLRDRPLSAL